MALALAIDLGGTKVLAGLINIETGEVLATAEEPTHTAGGDAEVFGRVVSAARRALQQGNESGEALVAVGIGAAGQIDSERGIILHAPNLPESLLGIPLGARLSEEIGAPVHVFNDLHAAAQGEASFGAAQDGSDFVVIFVGTGIGSALYQDGKVNRGSSNTAGEIGHTVVQVNGRLCPCGGRGHLEAYASRTAIVRAILGELLLGRKSVLSEVEPDPDPDDPAHSRIGQRELTQAVQAQDPLAVEAVEDAARYMGDGLVSVVNFYNPPLIVLGGGVVGGLGMFFKVARERALEQALAVPAGKIRIVPATLGENSGILGAAVLAARDPA